MTAMVAAAMVASACAPAIQPKPEVYINEIAWQAGELAIEVVDATDHSVANNVELLLYASDPWRFWMPAPWDDAPAALPWRVARINTDELEPPFAIALMVDRRVVEFWAMEAAFVAADGPAALAQARALQGGWNGRGQWLAARGIEAFERWQQPAWPTIGEPNDSAASSNLAQHLPAASARPCPWSVVPIGTIQGQSFASPKVGQVVSVAGTVVGSVDNGATKAVFVQDDGDGVTATADAIMVPMQPLANIGDRLCIRGQVIERDGMTSLIPALPWQGLGLADVQALQQSIDFDRVADWEALEGMRIAPQRPLVVQNSAINRLGTVAVAGTPAPVACGPPLPHAPSLPLELNVGRAHAPAWPESHYFNGQWLGRNREIAAIPLIAWPSALEVRLYPQALLNIGAPLPGRPSPPASADLRVVFVNLQNYFITLASRGARDLPALARQRARLAAMVVDLAPDLLGVTELENQTEPSALVDFVAALNEVAAARGQAANFVGVSDPQVLGVDAIRTALITRGSRLRATLIEALSTGPLAARPPTIARVQAGRVEMVVAVVHLKSRLCTGASAEELDQGEGCYAATRSAQVRQLVELLSAYQPSNHLLVLGDFNATPCENAILPLLHAGWWSVLFERSGVSHPYSYVHAGQGLLLDHIWLGPTLREWAGQAGIWHVNADFAVELGYATVDARLVHENGPVRTSDHDPVYVDLRGVFAAP